MESEGGSSSRKRASAVVHLRILGARKEYSIATAEMIGMASPLNATAEPTPFSTALEPQATTPYRSFFMWLDKHYMELGVSKHVKDGDGANYVNEDFVVIKVEERVALLENRVATIEKIRNVNRLVVVASVVALLVTVYAIGS
ncbi:hypothetical protein PIB30_056829 [Stylosanthes scabra]|uniref:Uncharacterized protein n=1 Tax=Stylosanthes scabra TaxID=79078 RepID=A0ABU6WKN3_9FABA|nr:hypothetical protein [Stylosanthes scabra]